MSTEALFVNISRHLEAIELCVTHKLRMPALILVYSGIDILASLNRPANKANGTRQDFMSWCETYLLPNSRMKCSSMDLYAARCGVVHAYSAESQLSRENKASEVVYSWGNQSPAPLQNILNEIGYSAHVVHIESFAQAFKRATEVFLAEVGEDIARLRLVTLRADSFFTDKPGDFFGAYNQR